MATCANCKTEETELYESSVPICPKCSDVRSVKRKPAASEQEIRATLLQDLVGATLRNTEAIRKFEEVTGQFPGGGLTQSDGVQRIKNASNALTLPKRKWRPRTTASMTISAGGSCRKT
jgi:DNA-directed RNA polymerase subunit RPC12/RpoP